MDSFDVLIFEKDGVIKVVKKPRMGNQLHGEHDSMRSISDSQTIECIIGQRLSNRAQPE